MRPMYSALVRRKLFDLSFHPAVRDLMVRALYMRYRLSPEDPNSFKYLLRAHRLAAGSQRFGFLEQLIMRNLQTWLDVSEHRFVSRETEPSRGFLIRTLVLKAPVIYCGSVQEKGVLLVAGHMGELYRLVDVSQLLKDYYLVFEPGWSGYATEDILFYCRFHDHPIIVQAPEETDFVFLKNLHTNLLPVRFGASDWVDHRIFRPLAGTPKEYDAVMVAVWGRYKRHHVLFKAIRALRHMGIRVALVGVPWQGSREEIEGLIDLYGIRSNVAVYENLEPEGVNQVLNRSKVNMILTLREGANRSIFEGFFANVPGIVLRNNIGINKSYVNTFTGKLIDERELSETILWFRNNWRTFSPREWAMKNISPEVTTAKLNRALRQIAESKGEKWTRDIVSKCNSPEPKYYPDPTVARGFPTVEEIIEKYRIR